MISGRNHISEHHPLTRHKIDWDSECVTYSTIYQQRLTLERWYTNSGQEPLNRSMSTATCTPNDSYMWPQTKPTSNRWIENNSNNRTITTTFTFWRPITSRQNWPIRDINTINTIIWRGLFTWLWRWLPLGYSKRQSPATVFLKTTFTWTITPKIISFSIIYIYNYTKKSRRCKNIEKKGNIQ